MIKWANPFYNNYVFSKDDTSRKPLHWRDKLSVLFRPMYVQITLEGDVVKYKTTADGRIFIYRKKKLEDR